MDLFVNKNEGNISVISAVRVEHVASSMSDMDAEAERKGVAGCHSGGLDRATVPSGVRHEHYNVLLMHLRSFSTNYLSENET